MKKRWILLALCLLLSGCGQEAPEPSSSDCSSAFSQEDFDSLPPLGQEDIVIKSYQRLSRDNLSYEEYFSRERYWEPDGWGYALFELDREESAFYQKELGGTRRLFYAHDGPIDGVAYWDNRYLFYFRSGPCIYRLFVPTCQVEKIYENEQMSGFQPLSNYAILFSIPNPANEGRDDEHDPVEPPCYFVYHSKTGEEWPLVPEEIGLDSIGGSVNRSARELYTIPEV
jgi:hypothetical protein